MAPRRSQGEEEVERDHRGEDDAEAEEDDLAVEVALGAIDGLVLRGGFFRSRMARLMPAPRLLRILKSVSWRRRACRRRRSGGRCDTRLAGDGVAQAIAGGQGLASCGPEEVDEQRHEQAPGQDAAGEVQRAEARADDVADAEVGGADGGSGERADAAGRDEARRLGELDEASLPMSLPTLMKKSFGGEELEAPSR